jgi:uncharacterized iron-regulated membrane protein
VRHEPIVVRRSWRRLAFAVHAWLAIKFSLLLAVILVSGTVATVSHELDWLLNPAIRIAPANAVAPDDVTPAQWAAAHAAVQRAYPGGEIGSIAAPLATGFAMEAIVRTDGDRSRRVYLDPTTAEVRGVTTYFNVQRFLRSLHYSLFIEQWGIYIVTSLAFLLIGSMVSGLIVYRRFWKGFARLPRAAATSRQRWGDLHKLVALWSIPFALIITVTSVWYFVEAAAYDLGVDPPEVHDWPLAQPAAAALPVAALVERVRAAYPDYRIATLHPPADADQAFGFTGQNGSLLVRARANKVWLDPSTGAVVADRLAAEQPAFERLVHTADELHFGTLGVWGGLWSKLLWFAMGAALCFVQLSGTLVWWKRLRQQAEREGIRGIAAILQPGGFALAALLLTGAVAWFGYLEISGYFAP